MSKHAYNQYALHSFVQEWRTAIFVILLLKLTTIAVSLYAGYHYLTYIIYPLVNNTLAANTISIITLLLIETLTAISLTKFFKFLLRKHLLTTISVFLFSMLIYSVSFYISTQGLSMRQSSQADKSATITDNYKTKITNTENLYTQQISDLKTEIKTIKQNPAGWTNGKRTVLTNTQLKQIENYNNKILHHYNTLNNKLEELKTEYNKKLKENNTNTTNTARKYYYIVVIIMSIQFICNGLLMFFYSRITHENNNTQILKEDLKTLKNKLYTNMYELLKSETLKMQNQILQNYTIQTHTHTPTTTNTQQNQTQAKKQNTIGFKNYQNTNNNENRINENRINVNPNKTNTATRTCKHCKKNYTIRHHKQLYCSDACRIAAWELRTGKKLTKKKNKQ